MGMRTYWTRSKVCTSQDNIKFTLVPSEPLAAPTYPGPKVSIEIFVLKATVAEAGGETYRPTLVQAQLCLTVFLNDYCSCRKRTIKLLPVFEHPCHLPNKNKIICCFAAGVHFVDLMLA